MANTIEITLRALDIASKEIQNVETHLKGLSTQSTAAGKQTDALTGKSQSLAKTIQPLATGFSQLTNQVARVFPQFSTLIGVSDNLAFSMLRASRGHATLGGALLAGVKGAFNPATLGAIALLTVVDKLVDSFIRAREEKQLLDKAFSTGDINLLNQALIITKTRLDEVRTQAQQLAAAGITRTPIPVPGGAFIETPNTAAIEAARQREADLLKQEQKIRDGIHKANETAINAMIEAAILERQAIGALTDQERERLKVLQEIVKLKAADQFSPEAIAELQGQLLANVSASQARRVRESERARDTRRFAGIEDLPIGLSASDLEDAAKAWQQMMSERQSAVQNLISANLTLKQGELDIAVTLQEKLRITLQIVELQKQLSDSKIAELRTSLELARTEEERQRILSEINLEQSKRLTLDNPAIRVQQQIITEAKLANTEWAKDLSSKLSDAIITGATQGQAGLQRLAAQFGQSVLQALLQAFTVGLSGGGAGGAPGGMSSFGGLGGIFGLLGSGGPQQGWMSYLGMLWSGWYGKGGIVQGGGRVDVGRLPPGITKFGRGGSVTRGPVLGVIGEEGDEIVARMKPARGGAGDDRPIQQTIYLVDRRTQPLGPNDVELIVADSIVRGRVAALAVQGEIRRYK